MSKLSVNDAFDRRSLLISNVCFVLRNEINREEGEAQGIRTKGDAIKQIRQNRKICVNIYLQSEDKTQIIDMHNFTGNVVFNLFFFSDEHLT